MLLGVMKNLPGVGHVEQVSPNGGVITDGSNSCTGRPYHKNSITEGQCTVEAWSTSHSSVEMLL